MGKTLNATEKRINVIGLLQLQEKYLLVKIYCEMAINLSTLFNYSTPYSNAGSSFEKANPPLPVSG